MFKQKITKSLAITAIISASIFNITPTLAGSLLLDSDWSERLKGGLVVNPGGNTGIISCKLPTEGNQCFPDDEQCHGDKIEPVVVEEMSKSECLTIGGQVMQP